jgi:hypothetical protein
VSQVATATEAVDAALSDDQLFSTLLEGKYHDVTFTIDAEFKDELNEDPEKKQRLIDYLEKAVASYVGEEKFIRDINFASDSEIRDLLEDDVDVEGFWRLPKGSKKGELWFNMKHIMGKPPSYPDGFLSSDDPMHVVNHEMGHVFHSRTLPKLIGRKFRAEDAKIAGRVSRYAQQQPAEFVAETFAGMAAGKTYDKDVMELYWKLRGPTLEAVQ